MQYTNVPKPIRASVRALKYARKSGLRLFGAHYPRNCTICGHSGRFFSYGFPLAADSMCPDCLSLERHRALAICAGQEPLFEGKDLLHFAPEPSLTAFIRSKGLKSYKTCDLFKPNVDLRIDICDIALPDQSFDAVLCLHVLEHVPDDRKAMSELRRILRPSGMAIIMVPMEEGLDETYENPSIVSEADRLIHFGQEDHVRYYGRDFRDRLRGAAFSIREWVSKEPYVLKHGLRRGERVFLCTRVE
jgi:SAM-dependent methyltransferase